MKRRLSLGVKTLMALAALLIAQTFVSCGTTDAASKNEVPSGPNVIYLYGNPTTGYTWSYEVEPEGLVSVEEQQNYLGAPDVCGAGTDFYYILTGLKEGSGKITFTYKRPWEETEFDETKVFQVTVASDLSATVTE